MGVSEPLIQTALLGEAVEHGPAAVFVADEHGRYLQGALRGTARLRRKDGSTVEFRSVAGATRVAGMPVYVSVGAAA